MTTSLKIMKKVEPKIIYPLGSNPDLAGQIVIEDDGTPVVKVFNIHERFINRLARLEVRMPYADA